MTPAHVEKNISPGLASQPPIFAIIEWSALRTALIILGLSVFEGIALIIGSYFYQDHLSKWELIQRSKLAGIEADHAKVKETLELVNSFYYRTYQQLVADRFFQKNPLSDLVSQREHLIKTVTTLIPTLKFPQADKTKYKLDQQSLFTIPGITTVPEFKVYKTQLMLTVGVLHEGDVLNLLDSLESQKFPGLFTIHRCSLKQLREINMGDTSQPYLEATCVLQWFVSEIENSKE